MGKDHKNVDSSGRTFPLVILLFLAQDVLVTYTVVLACISLLCILCTFVHIVLYVLALFIPDIGRSSINENEMKIRSFYYEKVDEMK
jgi:hypothetical protein